ncbi:acetyl-CoA synthetase [Sphaeroforma arctica JP610]|uniref:Acetyl-coenzyme A synthetase n=1 Tax=Sphaeroforma arctica JP610 TaxID=667725 RepID=A0A0L0FQN2_9EUKA|nr:acetyl-CoA synthetase [Sphaeroforma arctica JP610]KNC79070.1 acetyl-CoA synthetase [Sphaeroforma arctica JP610]|eukprot:XP_014152972.1 acetyl-CoA synthetase [Sphaeroforma arctica JP610]
MFSMRVLWSRLPSVTGALTVRPPSSLARIAQRVSATTFHSRDTSIDYPDAGGSPEYKSMYQRSIDDPDTFWGLAAKKHLLWERPYDITSSVFLEEGFISWFHGGKLNASVNCVDKHIKLRANATALIWEKDEPGQEERITYHMLLSKVCRMANTLRRAGVRKYDVVTLYMPTMPEAVYAMLACARLGATHSVVFAGFSADGLAARINSSNSTHVITVDEGVRAGKILPMKKTVDEAVAKCPSIKQVLVCKRTGNPVPMGPIDLDMNLEMKNSRPYSTAEVMSSEDLLFLLYTSGSTGAPKGIAHSTAGYLLYASMTHKYVFDYKEGDVFAFFGDLGWITGHSYGVYGPLMNGGTSVLFESTPAYPDYGRFWETVERLKINQLYTSPTAIRLLLQQGDEWVNKYDLSSLKTLGSVGEAINPEAYNWYRDVVGKGRCSIVDTWWQTETGGIMISPLAHDKDTKAGAATRPFFGVIPSILDPNGNELEGNDVEGVLAIKTAGPGMARTIYRQHERFLETYLKPFPGYFYTGDGAKRDKDGHIWITGRVDDVLNVSGHRIGTAELEAEINSHPLVAESAVVGRHDDIKGQSVFAYVTLMQGTKHNDPAAEADIVTDLKKRISAKIGGFARPDNVICNNDLPKTNSGKIMRRILRKVAAGEYTEIGDISTLNNPDCVANLIEKRKKMDK